MSELKAQVADGSFETTPPTSLERPIFEGTGEVPDDTDLTPLSDSEDDVEVGDGVAALRSMLTGAPA